MACRFYSIIFCLLLCAVLLVTKGKCSQEVFSHQAELDTEGNVFLSWTIRQDVITMELVVKALGYIAVGFSPSGGMKGADIVLTWVKGDEVFFKDMYAEGEMAPTEDPSQDYELIHASQNETHTKVSFRRNMKTCDVERDLHLNDDTVRLIWAYSDVDSIAYHGPVNRGSRSLYLTSSVQTPWEDKNIDNYKIWDVTLNNLTVPTQDSTVYWCKIFKVPKTTTKHQIVGYAADITKGNEGYVHHFLFYQCSHPRGLEDAAFGPFLEHGGHVCYGPNMPDAYSLCRITLLAWAIGSTGEMYPETAGAPVGKEQGGFDYYMLEVHYDNPLMTEGIVDSSGMKVFYTDDLRQYDYSTLELGHPVTSAQVVPPGQDSFTTVGSCSDSCTSLAIPPEGIKVFQVFLHAHTYGRAIRVRHFRDGKELPPLSQDNHYDFDYQQSRAIKPERLILPGDKLQTECIYETKGAKRPVFGGLSTQEEMCLAYLSYYPKIALGKCQSVPSPKDLAVSVGAEYPEDVEFEDQRSLLTGFIRRLAVEKLKDVNASLRSYLSREVNWDEETVARFQSTIVDKEHYLLCVTENNRNYYSDFLMEEIPNKDFGTKYGADTTVPKKCYEKVKKEPQEKKETPLKSFLMKKFGVRYQG